MKSLGRSLQGVQRRSLGLVLMLMAVSAPSVAQNGPAKLGVLTDLSSLYADNGGQGSVVAAQIAVDDFDGKVLGRSVQIVAGGHRDKADVGSAIARAVARERSVEVVLDVPNSAVALAVQSVTRGEKKLFLATGAATSRLAGDECSTRGAARSSFYWDLNDETRAWSKRFIEKTQKVPTMIPAGTYGAVMHYLKAVEAAGTPDGPTVAGKMREMPVNDFMTKSRIRQDGRLVRDMYLFRVKSPEESKYRFDGYEPLATIKRPSNRWRRVDVRC